jgi:hypothetical protein
MISNVIHAYMNKYTKLCDFHHIVPELIMVLTNKSVFHEVGIKANRPQR